MKHLAVSLLATQATNGLENTREMCHCRGNLQPPTCLESFLFFCVFLGGGVGGVSPPKALVKPALGATITRSSSHGVELGPLQSESLVTATGFGLKFCRRRERKAISPHASPNGGPPGVRVLVTARLLIQLRYS